MVKHNYLAIIVMVIVQILIGFLWYGFLFAEPWAMEGYGKSIEEFTSGMAGKDNSTPYIINIILTIFNCVFMSWLVQRLSATSFGSGFMVGLYASLGLALPAIAIHYAFLGKSFTLIAIDFCMTALVVMLTGGVLAAWRKK